MAEFDSYVMAGDYRELAKHISPVGSFRECFHKLANEKRGLKIVRPSLASNASFRAWYLAGVLLSGYAYEVLKLPELIAPMKTANQKWFMEERGRIIIEREYFGGEGDERVWNLDEFLDEFGRKDRGLDQSHALAVAQLLVDVVTKMHSTTLRTPDGTQLTSIPHLNLKPQNVLIGRDSRTGKFVVRLTDFLIPIANPIAQRAEVETVYNYSHPSILTDAAFYEPVADVFSCGLLIYKLLEGQDIIPATLGPRGTAKFIASSLQDKLKTLSLTSAGADVRNLINRCLIADKAELYKGVDYLKSDIDALLKNRDPRAEIEECVTSGGAAALHREKTGDEPRPRPVSKRMKAAVGGIVAIALLAVALIASRSCEEQKRRDEAGELRKEVGALFEGITSHLSAEVFDSYRDNLKLGDSLSNQQKYVEAITVYRKLSRTLKSHRQILDNLGQALDGFKLLRDSIESLPGLDSSFQEKYREGLQYLERGDLDEAGSCVRGLERYLREIRERIPYSIRERLQTIIADFPQGCAAQREAIYAAAVEACSLGEFHKSDSLLRELEALRDSPDCHENGGEIPEDSPSSIPPPAPSDQDCDSARQILRDLERNLSELRGLGETTGLSYELTQEHDQIRLTVDQARDRLNHGECSQAFWHAKSGRSSHKLLECKFLAFQMDKLTSTDSKDVKDCLALRESDIHAFHEAIKAQNWEEAREKFEQISTVCLKAPEPPTQYTISDCQYAFESSLLHDAMEVCRDVGSREVQGADEALKLYILSMGRELRFPTTSSEREQLLDDFSKSSIDRSVSVTNAEANVWMACAFGWNLDFIDCFNALKFVENARSFGSAGPTLKDWWRVLLIECRCKYRQWENSRELTDRQGALESIQDFEKHLKENNMKDDIPSMMRYRDEVSGYRNLILDRR